MVGDLFTRNILGTLLFLIVFLEFVAAIPEWYTASDGNEYLIEREEKCNWLQAYDECVRRDLHLIVVDNATKNAALDVLLRQIFDQSPNLWLGYHDEFNVEDKADRPFYSITNGEKLTFANWNSGEPNNKHNSEYCVHIQSKADFQWNDELCDKEYGYICEKPEWTLKCEIDMAELRQTINDMNEELLSDYANKQNEAIEILTNPNSPNNKDAIFESLEESTNEILTKSKASIDDIVRRKPYLQAIIADVGDEIREIIREALEDISKASQEAQQLIENVQWSTALGDVASDFGDKLLNNKNAIDNLFV